MEYTTEIYKDEKLAMRYIKFGSGHLNLVIIPGLVVRSIMETPGEMANTNSLFANFGFTVYIFDRKQDPAYPYSIEEMAEDTLYVIKKLGLEKPFLYGHCQGGMIILKMLSMAPGFFKKAAISSSSARLSANSKAQMQSWIDCARAHDVRALYEIYNNTLFSERVKPLVKRFLDIEASKVTVEELERMIPNTESMFDFDATEDLPKITTPCFVIGSQNDQLIDFEFMEEMAKGLHAESFFYFKSGHNAGTDKEDFYQRIALFFIL